MASCRDQELSQPPGSTQQVSETEHRHCILQVLCSTSQQTATYNVQFIVQISLIPTTPVLLFAKKDEHEVATAVLFGSLTERSMAYTAASTVKHDVAINDLW